MAMRLNDQAMRQFTLAKIQEGTNVRKSSLDFSADGRRLLVCDPSNLTLISSSRQSVLCEVHMQHYNPEVACFAQPENRVLHSSSKKNYSIFCLDMNVRSVVCQFCGHTKSARILSTQPGNSNIFISAGRDDQVYMWDFRVPTHTYHLRKLVNPLCAYDPAGMTFATTSKSMRIDIHDVRMLAEKPSKKFEYNNNDGADWTQLEFFARRQDTLAKYESFTILQFERSDRVLTPGLLGYCNEQRLPLKAAFTPDSQFVLSGDDHGQVFVWRASSGKVAALLRGTNVGPVRCLRFNPRATMFVSSNQRVFFWMPKRNGVYDWVEKEAPEVPPKTPPETQAVHCKSKANLKPFPQPIMMPMPMKERIQPRSWLSIPHRRLKRRRMGSHPIDLSGNGDESELEDGEIFN